MTISIIIPVYNVAPYVEQCILSVMHQTMRHGVECIIVDDCGNDDSMDRVEKLIAGYDGDIEFSILHHDHNRGLSAARNTGIDAARGQYLYFLDSDDWIVPECMELMLGCVKKYPGVDLVQGGIMCDRFFVGYKTSGSCLPDYISGDKLKDTFLNPINYPGTAWNKLVKSSVIKDNSLYFKENRLHEDDLWKFMLGNHVASICMLKHETYCYRTRENGLTGIDKSASYSAIASNVKECIASINPNTPEAQIKYIMYLVYLVYNSDNDFKGLKRDIARLLPWTKGKMYFYLLLFLLMPRTLHKRMRTGNRIKRNISFIL